MCTVIAAIGVWSAWPLVVAANRDEALDRPASPPALYAAGTIADRRVLAPRDLQAGGTWLGLNDAGLVVAITNRRVAPEPDRRSRGELVLHALGASDHRGARDRIAALHADDYNAFHLLMADRGGAVIVWSDGARLHELALAPGVHAITERSFEAGPSQRHATLTELAAALPRRAPPTRAQWRSILADHRPHAPADARPPSDAVVLDAMCVHADPMNYGTRSSTIIELGDAADAVHLAHATRRPCEAEFVDYADAIAALLAPCD